MEKKPSFRESSDAKVGTGKSPKHISKDPLASQIIRRLGNQPPVLVATAGQRSSMTPEMRGPNGVGSHPAFDNSRINAAIVPASTDKDPRKNVKLKLTSTKESPLPKDVRVAQGLRIRQ